MSCLVLTRNQLNGNHLQMYLSFIAHDCNCFSPGPQPATGDPGLFYFGIPGGRNGGSGFDTDGKRSVSPGEPPGSCSVSRRALHRSSCYSKTERRPLSETKPGELVSPRKRHIERRFGGGRDKTPIIYLSYLFSASGLAVAKGQTTCSEAFPNKKLCSVFKVLDVKTWRWHKAKCFAQQLFDVSYMAAAHKPQRINSRTTAGPCASIKKVENIFTVNVSHVLGDWRRFSSERFIAPSAVEGDFTVKFRLCLA